MEVFESVEFLHNEGESQCYTAMILESGLRTSSRHAKTCVTYGGRYLLLLLYFTGLLSILCEIERGGEVVYINSNVNPEANLSTITKLTIYLREGWWCSLLHRLLGSYPR